ncbi:chalcone-flavanone isomerase [Sphaeroforma arctica JP610]|uniref:Chalcone-flavanone isomerase n=1 Tax=Sphaeroforma arctica JP610 TaxID=667725 RepID=A0A0L0G0L4_9EUKA|nr:chalcone-flavanone isomerase [Sphaeroforma arctica JP610]KNC82381.1 chalcone-flavanone isomerase [Sphaeroforma arctica JP610]|eukprot:XP_014156283.1 chalcone-flavanone isomerase [Sphaeroforma arctica JP610]
MPMTDPKTGKMFKDELDGYKLSGCGPRQKKIFFVNVNVYAVGLYLDSAEVSEAFSDMKGKKLKDFQMENFYTKFCKAKINKKVAMIIARNLTPAQLSGGLAEGLKPRSKDKANVDKLEDMLKDETFNDDCRVTFTVSKEGVFTLQVDDKKWDPWDCPDLCNAITGVFFDHNCISPEARNGMMTNMPSLVV